MIQIKRLTLATICASSVMVAWSQERFTFGTATNPKGETIEVDSRGLLRDGRHMIPVMGEIHYSRVAETEWRREIRKMKAGGVTVISTYIFWNHHEKEEGSWDWSGNLDLHKFLETCGEEGMPVVIRVGPFCHGEVYQGGFPDWIVEKSISDKTNYKLRSEARGFLSAVRRLYANIYAQTWDMMWKNGGPVIGMQIENECRGPWSYYMTLKKIATEIGFDLPFYTRTGWPKLNGGEKDFGQMVPLYGDYADGFWDRQLTDMPGDYKGAFEMKETRLSSVIATEALGTNQDTRMEAKALTYPYLTCELGGGMMPSYHRRINMSGREILPLAICKLGSGSNLPGYYMYHGGTNPVSEKHTMAECQDSPVTNYNDMPHVTYDFQAPLGEMGQPDTEAYHTSRILHQFLADWGEELSQYDVDTLSAHYARRGCFVFRNDYVRIANEKGTATVCPEGMRWRGLTITSESVQPFAKTGDTLYFVTVADKRPQLTIGKKKMTPKADKPYVVDGKTIIVLSSETARRAFIIDGQMHYSKEGGILYKGDDGKIVEETWVRDETIVCKHHQTADAGAPRDVKIGRQKVAEQPSDQDFEAAARWEITPPDVETAEDYYLQIAYRGDCARIYADGELVEDNFWNGKTMLVRLSDLKDKKVELRVLPLSKTAPIYLQKEQRDILDATEGEAMLSLDGINVIHRIEK